MDVRLHGKVLLRCGSPTGDMAGAVYYDQGVYSVGMLSGPRVVHDLADALRVVALESNTQPSQWYWDVLIDGEIDGSPVCEIRSAGLCARLRLLAALDDTPVHEGPLLDLLTRANATMHGLKARLVAHPMCDAFYGSVTDGDTTGFSRAGAQRLAIVALRVCELADVRMRWEGDHAQLQACFFPRLAVADDADVLLTIHLPRSGKTCTWTTYTAGRTLDTQVVTPSDLSPLLVGRTQKKLGIRTTDTHSIHVTKAPRKRASPRANKPPVPRGEKQ